MKLKIQTTVTKTEPLEIEISLPHFCKLGNTYYQVISETTALKIDTMPSWASITLSNGYNPWMAEIGKAKEITEDQFNQAYHEVLMEIGRYVPAPPVPNELAGTGL